MNRPATVASLVAAAVLLLPGQASATVTKLEIQQGNSNGFGTSCTYTVTASTTTDDPVVFSDLGGANFTPLPVITATGGSATVGWTPTTPGPHLITATQGDNIQTIPLNVGTGVSTGSTSCRVF